METKRERENELGLFCANERTIKTSVTFAICVCMFSRKRKIENFQFCNFNQPCETETKAEWSTMLGEIVPRCSEGEI